MIHIALGEGKRNVGEVAAGIMACLRLKMMVSVLLQLVFAGVTKGQIPLTM